MTRTRKQRVKGKKVLVVGMGKSGIAAVQAMFALGAEVAIQDSKDRSAIDGQLLNFLEGKNVTCYFHAVPVAEERFDMLILSPGVDPALPFVQEAKAHGAEIIGELEIAYRIARGTFVAITGTNGKTTTTTLTGEIFKRSGRKTYVVGNIGVAVISKALEPDHLNRHHTMEAYGAAKARIFENQDESGYCIANYDDKLSFGLTGSCRAKVIPFSIKEELPLGAYLRADGMLVIKNEVGEVLELCRRDELKIIGDHNVQNALAAAAISYFAGIDVKTISEYCGEIGGVKFYNDSKGTNVDAAVIALKAIQKNIILIAGGDGKGQEFDELIANLPGRVKHMLLLGRDGKLIAEAAQKQGFTDFSFAPHMEACVKKAFAMAEPGDTVLLSPACASWDMYDNFEQRGDHFKTCVARLAE